MMSLVTGETQISLCRAVVEALWGSFHVLDYSQLSGVPCFHEH